MAGYQTINGTVIADAGRFTCRNCDVRVELLGVSPIATTHANSDGTFTFHNVRPGSYQLRVIVDGREEGQQAIEVYDGPVMNYNVSVFVNRRVSVERKPADSNIIDVSQYIQKYPKSAVERYRRAGDSKKRYKIDEAIKYLEEAIEIAPDFYHAHNDLGLLYKERGRLADAEREFLRAHEINRSSVDPLINLTGVYIDANKNEAAVSTGEEAVKTNQRSAPAFFNLGMALYRISQLDRAEAALKKALQLAPKMFQIRLMLANVYMKLQNFDRLMEQLDGYLAENPEGEERRAVEELRQKVLQAKEEVK
jgi:tetratricopeptide (TPR) repeat protein